MAETISMEEFAKLDLRAGKVVNAQKVPAKTSCWCSGGHRHRDSHRRGGHRPGVCTRRVGRQASRPRRQLRAQTHRGRRLARDDFGGGRRKSPRPRHLRPRSPAGNESAMIATYNFPNACRAVRMAAISVSLQGTRGKRGLPTRKPTKLSAALMGAGLGLVGGKRARMRGIKRK